MLTRGLTLIFDPVPSTCFRPPTEGLNWSAHASRRLKKAYELLFSGPVQIAGTSYCHLWTFLCQTIKSHNKRSREAPIEICEMDNGQQGDLLCQQLEATGLFPAINVCADERSPIFFRSVGETDMEPVCRKPVCRIPVCRILELKKNNKTNNVGMIQSTKHA